MDKKGFWALLASVSKAWRTIFTRTNDSFRFRQAADDDNILLPESNGRAVINTIYGNTVKWNQVCPSYTFEHTFNTDYTTYYISKDLPSSPTQIIEGHIYYYRFSLKSSLISGDTMGTRLYYGSSGNYINMFLASNNPDYQLYSTIRTATTTGNIYRVMVLSGRQHAATFLAGDTFSIKDFQLVDLTALEYPDIATTTPTVEEVEAWLALNVGTQEYYPYDEGSLISFKGQGVKSVGFNKWDEKWENGSLTAATGANIPDPQKIRSKNYIPVTPNTRYYFCCLASASSTYAVCCYDKNKNVIPGLSQGGYSYVGANTTYLTPTNCYYIRFRMPTAYGNTYNNNLCINISDAAKNRTYEPYWSDEKPFDVKKVYGKLNGAGDYVQCFPDGMKSAGSVSDELSVEQAVVNIGSVDLGTLSWVYDSNYSLFNVTLNSSYNLTSNVRSPSILCSKYITKTTKYNQSPSEAGYIWINDDGYSSTRNRIYLRDTHTSVPTSEDNWLSNVMLNYKLKTFITYTNLIYSEDGGVTGIPLTKLKYKVDKYSTEELLVPASEAGEPTSTAIIADIEYQITGHNYIDDLFVDMGLPSGTLWAKCDVDITKPNGFCDTPFTYEKSFFSWGNIDGHNPTSTLSFSPYDWGSSIDGEPYTSSKGNTLQANISTSKEYDAAMANLGQLFKMPTSTQFKELVDNCDFVQADGTTVIDDSVTDKRVTVNSIVGIYLKSKINGNLIFFSASGSGTGSTRNNRGAGGNYWSASFYSSRSAQNLYFNSGGVNPQNNYSRYLGFAIRPIKNQ